MEVVDGVVRGSIEAVCGFSDSSSGESRGFCILLDAS